MVINVVRRMSAIPTTTAGDAVGRCRLAVHGLRIVALLLDRLKKNIVRKLVWAYYTGGKEQTMQSLRYDFNGLVILGATGPNE